MKFDRYTVFSWALIRNFLIRKLAPAWVSYQDDFFILYHVYMMTGFSHISLFEGTLHVDKIHMWFKIANIPHVLPVLAAESNFTLEQVAFRVYMIPLRDFVPEWSSLPDITTGVNSHLGDSPCEMNSQFRELIPRNSNSFQDMQMSKDKKPLELMGIIGNC